MNIHSSEHPLEVLHSSLLWVRIRALTKFQIITHPGNPAPRTQKTNPRLRLKTKPHRRSALNPAAACIGGLAPTCTVFGCRPSGPQWILLTMHPSVAVNSNSYISHTLQTNPNQTCTYVKSVVHHVFVTTQTTT